MPDVFISYERSSEAVARKAAEALRAAGYEVWSDVELPAHRAYSEVIEERLQAARAVIVLWSAAAAKSQWVRAEAEYAREHGKLIQASLDDSLPPMPFNQIQCARLKGWNGERRDAQWLKVIDSLVALTSGSASLAATPRPAPVARPLRRKYLFVLVAGLAVLAAVAGSLWFVRDQRQRQLSWMDPQVSVAPFKALSDDPAARAFAEAADGEIAGKLSENQVPILAASQTGAAAFLISGAVEGDVGGRLHVRVRLDDAQTHATLWSNEFNRPATDVAGLRSEIGWRLTDVVGSAIEGRHRSRGKIDPANLALFIQARDAVARSDIEGKPLTLKLIKGAPNFAPGHVMACMYMLAEARAAQPADLETALDQALAECRRAAELDPHYALPQTGLAYGENGRHWARREAILRAGQQKDPGPDAGAAIGEFLATTGRFDESIRLLQTAVAGRKNWTIYLSSLGSALFMAGRTDEAAKFVADRLALRPEDLDLRALNFSIAAYGGPPDRALAIMDEQGLLEFGEGSLKANRAFLIARRSGAPADRQAAIGTILGAVDSMSLRRPYAVTMLAALGDLDDAFRLANAYSTDPGAVRLGLTIKPTFLFAPSTIAMREDPRFIPLVRELGLLDYWRSSNRWPDFCRREPKSVCAAMQQDKART